MTIGGCLRALVGLLCCLAAGEVRSETVLERIARTEYL